MKTRILSTTTSWRGVVCIAVAATLYVGSHTLDAQDVFYQGGYSGGVPTYGEDGQFIVDGEYAPYFPDANSSGDAFGAFAPPADQSQYATPNGFDFSSVPQVADGSAYLTPVAPIQNGANGSYDVSTADGAQFTILGDVTGSIPIGNSAYDSIPFLEERQFSQPRRLPELKVPQTDRELAERIDALKERFAHMPLSIQRCAPGRLLRYSLIGGADQTFMAPSSSDDNAERVDLKPIYALGALCWNFPCAERRLLRIVNGKPTPTVGFGFQTKRGEFLAALAYARIDRDYEMSVDGRKFRVQDLVEAEKAACSSQADLSLVAVGLAHYSQNADENWINESGEVWNLARILEQESRRQVDWDTESSLCKLTAFAYLLARLKQSEFASASDSRLAVALKRTEEFLLAVKERIWTIIGDDTLSSSLFFNDKTSLENPYMRLYVNGKLLLWLSLVSSQEEMKAERMRRADAELCALVDQLFNSLDNLESLSATDEESLAVAMQALNACRKSLPEAAPIQAAEIDEE